MIQSLVRTSARRVTAAVRHTERWLFAREVLRRPGSIGAICPSSLRLAQRMAAHVPANGHGVVVELGAGTGVVTQALLARGVAPQRLVVIERSPAFVRHLRARFPGLDIILGSAAHLSDLLAAVGPVDAIVSSLPLRAMPAEDVNAIAAQWHRVLGAGGRVIQYTYDLRDGGRLAGFGFTVCANETVWANLPPARLQVLEKKGSRLPGNLPRHRSSLAAV